jgi:hypothetical protein
MRRAGLEAAAMSAASSSAFRMRMVEAGHHHSDTNLKQNTVVPQVVEVQIFKC